MILQETYPAPRNSRPDQGILNIGFPFIRPYSTLISLGGGAVCQVKIAPTLKGNSRHFPRRPAWNRPKLCKNLTKDQDRPQTIEWFLSAGYMPWRYLYSIKHMFFNWHFIPSFQCHVISCHATSFWMHYIPPRSISCHKEIMYFKNEAVKFWQGTYPVSKRHMEKNDKSSLSQDAIVAKDEGLALDPQTWLSYPLVN